MGYFEEMLRDIERNYLRKVICITSIKDLQDFVNAAQKVDGSVYVNHGHFLVSGSSLMGMMSIDTSKGITVFYPKTAADFEKYLLQFEVEV